MDDIEIEFDSDDDAEVVVAPVSSGPAWKVAIAFWLAAVLLIVAPFSKLYSMRLGGYFAINGWGSPTIDATDGLSIAFSGPMYGIGTWTAAALCAGTAGLQLGSPTKCPPLFRLLAAAVSSALVLGGAGILALDMLPELKDSNTQVGPFLFLVGAAVVACGVGVALAWRAARSTIREACTAR
jgi:hypothetical protein